MSAPSAVRVARHPRELRSGGPRAITIGNFDGVHLGHRRLVAEIVARGMTSTVVTFDPHPRVFFGAEVEEISSLDRRLELLAGAGVDEILVLRFDAEMAALEAGAWIERYLRPIDAREVVVGEGFRFGRGRAGDTDLLRAAGLDVRALDLVPDVSSTRVRELVGQGALPCAARLLGRSHELDATVVQARRGRGTTRLTLEPLGRRPALPPSGRYAARLERRPAVLDRSASRGAVEVWTRAWEGAVGDRLRIALDRSLTRLRQHGAAGAIGRRLPA